MDFGIQAPEKNTFKFNEVTSLTGVKPYVLRFWETEFEQISPLVNENGHKLYDRADLLVVKTIKKLLFEDKLSIPEAKGVLDREIEAVANAPADESMESEADVQARSQELKEALEDVIERGSSSEGQKSEYVSKTSPVAARFKKEVRIHNRSLSDAENAQLAQAKEKLEMLLTSIEELEKKRAWSL